jgi:hypothetical protein
MGLPATGKRGLAVVKVWGRRREPRPAMGMIMFIVVALKGLVPQRYNAARG